MKIIILVSLLLWMSQTGAIAEIAIAPIEALERLKQSKPRLTLSGSRVPAINGHMANSYIRGLLGERIEDASLKTSGS